MLISLADHRGTQLTVDTEPGAPQLSQVGAWRGSRRRDDGRRAAQQKPGVPCQATSAGEAPSRSTLPSISPYGLSAAE
jgi:hypothetical protein